MPKDIRINFDMDLMEGDFVFDTELQDYESDEGLETTLIISLFTDRRAQDDDVLPDSDSMDRKGWWGDLASPIVEGDQIGSRLWLLNREKTLSSTLQRAKQYVSEALQWMLDDGVAVRIDVNVERQGIVGHDMLAIQVKIYQRDGVLIAKEYELQWTAQALR